jgi:ABC-type branched-subunit amino acid transport system ATPase component
VSAPVTVPEPDPAEGTDEPAYPALLVEGLVVRFGGLTAIGGVSLVVHPGETVGLIGANGAGKTTLMDCISGFIEPDEGSISAGGVELSGMAPELRPYAGLCRSFQDARLFPGLTVEESLLVSVERNRPTPLLAALTGLAARGREREKRQQVDDLIATLGLDVYREKRISELSTGTRRVVDIASFMTQRPTLLLLDEPTAGIAQRETEAFAPMLAGIKDQLGCAVLIIEHDMPLIMSLSDRVYAMESGRVSCEGTPDVVRSDPRVVASYLGTDAATINRSDVGRTRSGSVKPRSVTKKPGSRKVSAKKTGVTTTAKKPAAKKR